MTEKLCTCDQCSSGEYDPAYYKVSDEEIRQLNNRRPFGLSGHMVAKNEALTIKESVESVLPALDELIITYQTSRDRTEEILRHLQQEYPDKLRIFHYKPYLPPYGRLADRKESGRYAEKSIHNPANYYNFGLVRHRFAFYMKVDGDQVYFTEKLQNIRNELYRLHQQPGWKRGKPARQFCRKLFWANYYLMRFTPFHLFPVISRLNRSLFALAFSPDFAYSMAGLNVRYTNSDLTIPVKPLDFNSGVGDHFILPATSKTFYSWSGKNLYEYFRVPKFVPIGFCWLHFKYVKIAMDGQFRELPAESVPLSQCKDLYVQSLLKKASSAKKNKRNQIRTMLLTHFWDQDKQFVHDLPELTQKVERFLNEHSQDFEE